MARIEDRYTASWKSVPTFIRKNRIIDSVAETFGVKKEEMLSASRVSQLARARFAAAYIMRRRTNMSFPLIGKALGNRDHKTIMHAIDRARDLAQSSESFRSLFLSSEIKAMSKKIVEWKQVRKPDVPVYTRLNEQGTKAA